MGEFNCAILKLLNSYKIMFSIQERFKNFKKRSLYKL